MKRLFILSLALLGSCAKESFSYRLPGANDETVTSQGEDPAATGEDSRVPLAPNFKSIKANIFQRSCLQCHAPGQKEEDLDLSSLKALLDEKLIVPGNPDASDLVRVLNGSKPRKAMPPAKAKLPAVTEQELAVIREWIQSGAPES